MLSFLYPIPEVDHTVDDDEEDERDQTIDEQIEVGQIHLQKNNQCQSTKVLDCQEIIRQVI